jgi:DNA-binding CsgD family transcriptional regulator
MLNDRQAGNYFSKMYLDVWTKYSTSELHKYYDTSLISRSGQYEFGYDELHSLIEHAPNRFSFMIPEIHHVKAVSNDTLTAWFTTRHYDFDNKVAMCINTMSNYKIKNNKIISNEFIWDQTIDLVMGYETQQSLSRLNKILPLKMQNLTLRELQCFFHLIQTKSAKEIARELNISARTVESHSSNIKEKLGLPSTRAVVEYAFEHRLVSLSPLLQSIFKNEDTHEEH